MLRFITQLLSTMSATIPHNCIICRQHCDDFFCEPCFYKLPFFDRLKHCRRCAHPIHHNHSYHCGPCLIHPPATLNTIPLFDYQQPIITLINQLKFFSQHQYAYLFAKLLSQNEYIKHSQVKAIMPMPLHNKRLQQRGFNQALHIAKHLSKIRHLPLVHYAKRVKNTPSQRGLTAIQRKENIKNAFQEKVPNQHYNHIALVDDVITTGSSMNELALSINRAYPIITEAWCIAKVN